MSVELKAREERLKQERRDQMQRVIAEACRWKYQIDDLEDPDPISLDLKKIKETQIKRDQNNQMRMWFVEPELGIGRRGYVIEKLATGILNSRFKGGNLYISYPHFNKNGALYEKTVFEMSLNNVIDLWNKCASIIGLPPQEDLIEHWEKRLQNNDH